MGRAGLALRWRLPRRRSSVDEPAAAPASKPASSVVAPTALVASTSGRPAEPPRHGDDRDSGDELEAGAAWADACEVRGGGGCLYGEMRARTPGGGTGGPAFGPLSRRHPPPV
jgi:hypothetical protein